MWQPGHTMSADACSWLGSKCRWTQSRLSRQAIELNDLKETSDTIPTRLISSYGVSRLHGACSFGGIITAPSISHATTMKQYRYISP